VCDPCLAQTERMVEPVCESCGVSIPPSTAVRCRQCAKDPPAFSRARSIARYRSSLDSDPSPLPSLIRRHKYGLDQSLEKALAEFIGDEIPFCADDVDVVVPVPLHRKRLWWRGFNQAALLSIVIARRLERPVEMKALVRLIHTIPQTTRDHDERRRNVRDAFAVARPDRIQNRRILLVDDVMTTGATADECARVLVEAGARLVNVLTLARVL